MSEMTDLQQRLARLEAQVAGLLAREGAPSLPLEEPGAHDKTDPGLRIPPLAPPLPPPAPRLPEPSGTQGSPILIVAAIGAVIFLLGAVFFLHLAIQRGWIGPEMRFLLGLVVGCGLLVGSALMVLGRSPKLGSCILLAGLGTLMFTLRWGSLHQGLIPVGLGFGGSAVAALFAGGLAGRARFSPPLWVGLLAGLLSPLVFSQGGHHEIALTLYLAALMGAALLVPYLSGVGARWGLARWIAVVGTWLLVALSCAQVLREDAALLMALLVLHYLLAGLWIWLPWRTPAERPGTPTLLWVLVSLASTSLAWVLWKQMHLTPTWFCLPILLVAAINLGLVKPLRERLEGHGADLGLLVLAAGHLALAVPVALDWKWVGLLWGVFSLGLAGAVTHAEGAEWEAEEQRSLLLLALGMGILATGVWAVHTIQLIEQPGVNPFFNRAFAEALLSALSWGLLARRGGFLKVLGLSLVELIANLALALEFSRGVRWAGGTSLGASISMTLVWAASGALQWLRSLSLEEEGGLRTGLAIAGYTWLAIAGFKLILVDMSEVDAILRALAFLGVGVIFLVAALTANRIRLARKEGE